VVRESVCIISGFSSQYCSQEKIESFRGLQIL